MAYLGQAVTPPYDYRVAHGSTNIDVLTSRYILRPYKRYHTCGDSGICKSPLHDLQVLHLLARQALSYRWHSSVVRVNTRF